MQFLSFVLLVAFITKSFLSLTLAQDDHIEANTEMVFDNTTENFNPCENSNFLVADNTISTRFVEGVNITLLCKNNVPMRCHWLLNGILADVPKSQRYHYCNENNGNNTFDCSIYIINYKPLDAGNWSCIGAPLQKGHHEHVKMEHFTLQGSESLRLEQNSTSFVQSTAPTTPLIMDSKDPIIQIMTSTLRTESSQTLMTTTSTPAAPLTMESKDPIMQIVTSTQRTEGSQTSMTTTTASTTTGRLTVALKLVEYPQNDSISIDAEYTLKCVFNTNTNCLWKRTGQNAVDIEIDGWYMYPNGENGQNTKDCSLRLIKAREEDTGHWTCTSKDSSAVFGQASLKVISSGTTIKPHETKRMTFLVQPQNVTISHSDSSADLKCIFESAVEICAWKKDGTGIAVMGSYQFTFEPSGRNTTDCSLRINRPDKDRDEGCWTCEGKYSNTSIESTAACLHFQGTPKNTPKPSPNQAHINFPSSGKDEEKIEEEAALASNSAVTVAVSCVVVSLIGIAVTIFLCMYKRKKYIFAPKSDDVKIQTEFLPKRPKSSAQLEEAVLLRASMNPNGKSKVKISESEASQL